MKTIVVIGGGPSGIMAAISAKKHHPQDNVILLERNEKVGKKLGFTGGGRCNVTANVSVKEVIEHVCKNGKFLYSSLEGFGPQEIIEYFEGENCPLKEEDHGRMFPMDNKSQTIIQTLENDLHKQGVDIRLNTLVEDIDPKTKSITTSTGTIHYDYLIITTGGKVLPGSGSDGSGYRFAEKIGHTITELLPAEVPLVSNDSFIQEKTLQGLSFKDVRLDLMRGKKKVKSITHDLLFTHFGISGPAALRMSFFVQKELAKENKVTLNIDFLPEYTYEQVNVDLIQEELPKRLVEYLKSISENDTMLIQHAKKFPMSVYETRGFSLAFVTNGGISVKEIEPKTMKSKINPQVSFAGEVLDYNAFTGGYNITSALSSGYTAGKYVY